MRSPTVRGWILGVQFLVLSLFVHVLAESPSFAQSADATLTGRVLDPSNAVVADAEVTAVNSGTNVKYSGTANGEGIYTIAHLLPGIYQIEVSKQGFKTMIKPDVTFHVQDVIVLNFTLPVGSASESITVTGGAPTIELGTETLGGVIDSRTMLELPLNGRDWTQLATLQPGVISLESMQQPVSNSNQRGFRGYGIQMSISGSRPQQNNYLIDGVSANDYTNGGPGSVQGLALGVDAIQEFTVLTSNYSAEYGRSSGGVISAITRSGTNAFHGDAYEFVRDSSLDARNYFDTGAVPPFNWNQFGGSQAVQLGKTKRLSLETTKDSARLWASVILQRCPRQMLAMGSSIIPMVRLQISP